MDDNYLLSRQPIFGSKVDIIGYEVRLFSDEARTIFSTLTDSGLDQIVGEYPAFISLTAAALTDGSWREVSKSRVVLGYFDDFGPSDEPAQQLSELVAGGYSIALSGSLCAESLDMLGSRAQALKLDVTAFLPDELEERVKKLRRYQSKIYAVKVDTYDDLEFCKSLEINLYEGHFLCKPAVRKKELPVNRIAMIRLLSRFQDPAANMGDLEKLISHDVALSVKLLRYVNSAALALRMPVNSIGHALRLTGIDMLRTWASVLLMSSVDDKPRELLTVALVRSRMCERLSNSLQKQQTQSFSLAGLLSVLDALLDCPMEKALIELPVSDEIKQALIGRSGAIGQALRCTIAYERANWDEVQFYGLAPALIRDYYMEALPWARKISKGLAN